MSLSMYEDIARKLTNLLVGNAESIERDYVQSIRQSDEPEKVKFPISFKCVLLNPDGNSKKARITMKWAAYAEHCLECDVEDKGEQDDLIKE